MFHCKRLKSAIFGTLQSFNFGKFKCAIFGRLKCAIFGCLDLIWLQLFIVYIEATISSKMMKWQIIKILLNKIWTNPIFFCCVLLKLSVLLFMYPFKGYVIVFFVFDLFCTFQLKLSSVKICIIWRFRFFLWLFSYPVIFWISQTNLINRHHRICRLGGLRKNCHFVTRAPSPSRPLLLPF